MTAEATMRTRTGPAAVAGALSLCLSGILLSGAPLLAQAADGSNATIARPGTEARTVWPGSPRDRGLVARGLPVSPTFEGWYENPDGTYTFSFGYFNRNAEEVVIVPRGADNSVEPAAYDGGQPTVFEAVGRRGYSHGSATGVFTVTVPGSFAEDGGRVVWTVRSNGFVHSVPGRIGSETYQLSLGPQAMGSLPPALRLEEDGPELWGPFSADGDPREGARVGGGDDPVRGGYADPVPLAASVETPLGLVVWARDRSEDTQEERGSLVPGVTWFTHQGPAVARFEEKELEAGEDGRAATRVTFPEPGRYLLRVRADNFNPVDSTPGDQCCWTNGYFEVTVSGPGEGR